MPDQNPTNSETVASLLNKQTQDALTVLTTGTLLLVSELPVDPLDLQNLVDAAGNSLTELPEEATHRDYAQAQHTYALAKEVQQALDIVLNEPSALAELAERETAAITQMKAVGTQLMPMAATALPLKGS